MSQDIIQSEAQLTSVDVIRAGLAKEKTSKGRRITEKFAAAALGAIPWVGGFVAAAAQIRSDESGVRSDDLRTQWLGGAPEEV